MILIGQYDSPFVRRVGITLEHYQLPFEHRPWSVWGNADQIAEYNPLRRVPVLISTVTAMPGPSGMDFPSICIWMQRSSNAHGTHRFCGRLRGTANLVIRSSRHLRGER